MEHIVITDLGNGYVRLTAEEGWQLYSLALQRVVDEAIVESGKVSQFKAIEK